MSKNNTQDDYEIGYGKPPKNTQFQKGISGNPRGRPKKSLDFNEQLLRESESFITVNENGRKKRISKQEIAIKVLIKQVMNGSSQAFRIYFALLQETRHSAASSAPQQSIESLTRENLETLTDEQLMILIHDGVEQDKRKCGMGHFSNAEFIETRGGVKLLSSSTLNE
jgi:hypothetical protein